VKPNLWLTTYKFSSVYAPFLGFVLGHSIFLLTGLKLNGRRNLTFWILKKVMNYSPKYLYIYIRNEYIYIYIIIRVLIDIDQQASIILHYSIQSRHQIEIGKILLDLVFYCTVGLIVIIISCAPLFTI